MIYIKRIFICIIAALMLAVALPAQVCAVEIGDFDVTEGVEDFFDPDIGDVNGDGEINSKDSNLLKKYLAGEDVKVEEYNANIHYDAYVDAKDSNLLKKIITGVV